MPRCEGVEKNERIESLLALAKTGDNEAINKLWALMESKVCEAVRNVYYRKMYFFDNNGVQIVDLQQEGYFAFRRAIETFKKTSADEFCAWLWVIEKHWMLSLRSGYDAGRSRRIAKSDGTYCIISANPIDSCCKSLDEQVSTEDGDASTLGELLPDPAAEKAFTEVEERELTQMLRVYIKECLAKLPKDERKVLRAKYYANLSDEKVAELLGIPIRAMTRKEQIALYRLRSEKILKELYDDYIAGNAYKGVGVSAWKHYGSVEERIIEAMESHIDRKLAKEMC